MTTLEQLTGLSPGTRPDIKLEVVLADLLADGMSLDELVIVNASLFKRNYHPDIEDIREIESGGKGKKKLCFVVNRAGIYDQLPEDLFHQPPDTGNNIDKLEVIRAVKARQELEKQSRLFFLPIEQEFYRQQIKLEVEERKLLFETNDILPGGIFDYLWDLPAFLEDHQKSKLGALIPVLNQITGNTALAEFIVERITGDRVGISETAPLTVTIEDGPSLDQMQLGIDTVFGGRVSRLQRGLTLSICVPEAEGIVEYLPGGRKAAVYDFLCSLLVPFDRDIIFELDLSKASASFILEDQMPSRGKLNYTTII
jgi:hypothetical protein